jgi:hypothetical protein
MKNKSVRLALVSVVAVLSVFGLSMAPADASGRAPTSRGLCCG